MACCQQVLADKLKKLYFWRANRGENGSLTRQDDIFRRVNGKMKVDFRHRGCKTKKW